MGLQKSRKSKIGKKNIGESEKSKVNIGQIKNKRLNSTSDDHGSGLLKKTECKKPIKLPKSDDRKSLMDEILKEHYSTDQKFNEEESVEKPRDSISMLSSRLTNMI